MQPFNRWGSGAGAAASLTTAAGLDVACLLAWLFAGGVLQQRAAANPFATTFGRSQDRKQDLFSAMLRPYRNGNKDIRRFGLQDRYGHSATFGCFCRKFDTLTPKNETLTHSPQ